MTVLSFKKGSRPTPQKLPRTKSGSKGFILIYTGLKVENYSALALQPGAVLDCDTSR
jgi:hypothetical protein